MSAIGNTKAMNMPSKVRTLQLKLYHSAKQSLDRKFGALYDKIYRMDVLNAAWNRVRVNNGAPGYDRQSIEHIQYKIGVSKFLTEIHKELHAQKYKPKAVLRCWIDKPGKSEKRPLGIPIVKDRIIQMAAKIVIEPLFEPNFLECSYGFRPKRNAHQAMERINKEITFGCKYEIIDADIKGYFDNIDHGILMNLVSRRINDKRVLKLIRGWLESGVMDSGNFVRHEGVGAPQGGCISPLLANIYLHSFDKMFEQSGIDGTLVRYCDDFVILLRSGAKTVLRQIKRFLTRLKLELHEGKTRIAHARNGFDFLGVHFRLTPTKSKRTRRKYFCARWPSNNSMKSIRQKIKERIGRKYGHSLEQVIRLLNPLIKGWKNYHSKICLIKARFRKLDEYVRLRLRIFIKRKYTLQNKGCGKLRDNLVGKLGLAQFVF